MAHQLTTRADGYTEMAFVGETPWHGLGQSLDKDASIETWAINAGMDWTINRAPVLYTGNEPLPVRFEGQNVLYRSDTNAPLSVVSDRYKPVQPIEVLEFFRDLVEQNGFRLHTAGTLFGGKRLWALAETGKFAEISKGDGIGGFLLLSTSADRSLATTARFTTVRVVCNNTLSMAMQDGTQMVSYTHATHFKKEIMQAKLGIAVESFGGYIEMAKTLQKQKLTDTKAKLFVRNLVVKEGKSLYDTDNDEKNRAYRKIIDLFQGDAKGVELAGNTKWGMLNAVTEYYDHHHPARTADARLNQSWFGTGESKKAVALETLLAI
jgi:phage/plasmid-like protein (TIGR03299 family)